MSIERKGMLGRPLMELVKRRMPRESREQPDAHYSAGFYATYARESYCSAKVITGVVAECLPVGSVIDIGCGTGTWLRAWQERGVSDIVGVDGEYVERSALQFDSKRFLAIDLCNPGSIGRKFDLAETLEVAEHIPRAMEGKFMDFVCSASDAIVFSAAVPYQGGRHHVNEQWPEYWAELFGARGFRFLDAIRPHVWNDPEVAYYYAQNTFLVVRECVLATSEKLARLAEQTDPKSLSRVHPKRWMAAHASCLPFEKLLAMAPASLRDLARRGARKLLRSCGDVAGVRP